MENTSKRPAKRLEAPNPALSSKKSKALATLSSTSSSKASESLPKPPSAAATASGAPTERLRANSSVASTSRGSLRSHSNSFPRRCGCKEAVKRTRRSRSVSSGRLSDKILRLGS